MRIILIDAGTPGIHQSIRAGLAFKVKGIVGNDAIKRLEHKHCVTVLKSWNSSQMIALMGADCAQFHDPLQRVSIFSFNILSPIKVSNEWGVDELLLFE